MLSVFFLALSLVPSPDQDQPATPEPRVSVRDHPDESESFELLFALDDGGGASTQGNPSLFAGAKLGFGCCIQGKHRYETGRTITLDLGYDRAESSNGFSAELSVMIPVVRFPRPRREASNYLRVYVEPGGGLRAGKGFGTYASVKAMLALLSDRRIVKGEGSPFVELQRCVTLVAPHRSDTRLIVGMMVGLCKHCGFD